LDKDENLPDIPRVGYNGGKPPPEAVAGGMAG